MIEYGVRRYGGHVKPALSRHLAVREVERLIARGEKPTTTYVVQRHVTEWERS